MHDIKLLKTILSTQLAWTYIWATTFMLIGCQAETQNADVTLPQSGRKADKFVKAITHHYTIISKADSDPEYGSRVGGARTSDFPFTVGATYKEDTFRILLPDLWHLNEILKRNGLPADSLLMASLVKGEKLLEFDVNSMHSIDIIRKWKSIDSIKRKGKEYFIDYYFNEKGVQKVAPLSPYEMAYMIDILSDWGILVALDDESGFYYLYEKVIEKYNK